jgi:DNA-binding response OmpR family regulator
VSSELEALNILLIEDQTDLAQSIWDYLERRGHCIDHAADGASGLRMALENRFDVIVLDLGLPRMDGLELCRRLRADTGHGTAVLMLTARDTLEDKLRGFAEGADDYLVKPFVMRELEARILNLRRRRQVQRAPVLQYGPLQLDLRTREVSREGASTTLSAVQARMLDALMRAAPGLVRSEELLRCGWGDDAPGSMALHKQIHALRAAIDRPFDFALLHTVHGLGYRIEQNEPSNAQSLDAAQCNATAQSSEPSISKHKA